MKRKSFHMNHTNLLYANLAGVAVSMFVFGAPMFSTANFATAATITAAHFAIQSPQVAVHIPKVTIYYETQKPRSSIMLGVAGALVASRFF
jgi:hypothetical protein